ncbi:hypothetical protein MNBD_UNCLBAC01-1785 [hydrothermal vent metagenome]|uniref:Uncharacterized protein n=1 Tax=hydrothermal vent metagenome TaxID=652676 RepID=A0A3B1D885_9ZZZZ
MFFKNVLKTTSFLFFFFFIFVSGIEACPVCIKSSGGYLDKIFMPIGGLLLAPFIIFFIIFFIIKKFIRTHE